MTTPKLYGYIFFLFRDGEVDTAVRDAAGSVLWKLRENHLFEMNNLVTPMSDEVRWQLYYGEIEEENPS